MNTIHVESVNRVVLVLEGYAVPYGASNTCTHSCVPELLSRVRILLRFVHDARRHAKVVDVVSCCLSAAALPLSPAPLPRVSLVLLQDVAPSLQALGAASGAPPRQPLLLRAPPLGSQPAPRALPHALHSHPRSTAPLRQP
jgi:hypothetical protein